MPDSHIFDFTSPIILDKLPNGQFSAVLPMSTMDTAFMKLPFLSPPYHHSYLAPLGAVLVQWGAYEGEFEDLLKSLIRFNGREHLEMDRGYKRRIRRFKEEVALAFFGSAELINHCINTVNSASSIYWKRNLLAHGRLETHLVFEGQLDTLSTDDFAMSIIASGERSGKELVHEFSMMDLKKLYYEIGHLHGKIAQVASSHIGTISQLPSREKLALQNFQRMGRPFPATSSTPAPPP
jgi:hypothetical protein